MIKDVSAVDQGQVTSLQKKKDALTENKKKKKDKKSAKGTEAVKEINSKKIQNTNAESAKKEKNKSFAKFTLSDAEKKSDKLSSASPKKQNKGTSKTTKSSTETKDIHVNVTTNRGLQDNLGKGTEMLPTVVKAVSDEEHVLDYGPEAILIAAEDDHHEETEIEDGGNVPHSVATCTTKELHDEDVIDLDFLSEDEEPAIRRDGVPMSDEIESMSGSHIDNFVQTPKKYREGTAGGRLFEAQTLAEIDGYLYLGKVSKVPRKELKSTVSVGFIVE